MLNFKGLKGCKANFGQFSLKYEGISLFQFDITELFNIELMEQFLVQKVAFKISNNLIQASSSYAEPSELEKLQNGQNWPFQINSNHFGRKILEKFQNCQNWPFQINLDHFGRKILEKLQNGQN